MMYHAIASKLTVEGKRKLDALLGDPVARREQAAADFATLSSVGKVVVTE